MNEPKYLILCLNTAHPTNQYAFFLLEGEYDNTLVFDRKEDAATWIKENRNWNSPFLFAIITTNELHFYS